MSDTWSFVVPDDAAGERLDRFVAREVPDTSRSALARWIRDGQLTLDGAVRSPSTRLRGGEIVSCTPPDPRPSRLEPEDLPLRGGGQGADAREAAQESLVVGQDGRHLRLLEHDLGDPDPVGGRRRIKAARR